MILLGKTARMLYVEGALTSDEVPKYIVALLRSVFAGVT